MKKIKWFNHSIEREKKYGGWIFVAPWILGFLMFFAFPFVKTLLLSFSDVQSLAELSNFKLTGVSSYARAFVFDVNFLPLFLGSIEQTVISTILVAIFSLFLALLLNSKIRCRGLFRGIFFLPFILGTGALAQAALDPIQNTVILGSPERLLGMLDSEIATVVMNLLGQLSLVFWRSSVQTVIFLSGLQGISDSLYESAQCDGATGWESFWKITLPMLTPTLTINLVFTIVDTFTDPRSELLTYMYDTIFKDLSFSYGAAMGMLYFVFVLLFVGIVYGIASRRAFYAGER